MNNITIYGRLTKDPEQKFLQSGDEISSFSIADNHGRDKVSFWNCTAFGKTAAIVNTHFQKGKEIIICGSIEQRKYQTDNGERTAYEVKVREVTFCGSKDSGNEQQQQRESAPAPRRQQSAPARDIPNDLPNDIPADFSDPFEDQ